VNIAFVGPQGSGKSTLAGMLEQRRVHPYTVLPIAEAIRTVATLSYGDDFDKVKLYSQRRMGLDIEVSGREILQDIGGQLRDIDANRLVAVDDVRLPLEAHYLRHHIPGIVIVRVHATAEARTARRGVLQGVGDVTEFGYLQTEYDLQIDTTDLTAEDSYAILRRHMVDNGLWQSSYEEES